MKELKDKKPSSLDKVFEKINVKTIGNTIVKVKSSGNRRKKERRQRALEREKLRGQRSAEQQLKLLEERLGESCKEKKRLFTEIKKQG